MNIFTKLMMTLPLISITAINLSQAADPASNLRARDRILSYEVRQTDSTTDRTIGVIEQPTQKLQGSLVDLEFGHNYGLVQTSLILGRSLLSNTVGTSELTTDIILYGLGLRYNFIENKTPNDLIPYIKLDLGVLTQRTDDGINKTLVEHGSDNGLSIGLDWFPFSQIFAVDFQIFQSKAKTKATYLGNNVDMTRDTFGGAIGFNLYF